MEAGAEAGGSGMNDILLVTSCILGMVLVAGLEGGALSAGQAALGLIPVCFLLLASFMRSGWYGPAERGGCQYADRKRPIR